MARAWFGLLHHATKWLTSELWKWTSGPVNPITERPYPLICPFSFTDDPTAQKLRRRYITAGMLFLAFFQKVFNWLIVAYGGLWGLTTKKSNEL